ncbi:MAG: crossover junction endodeoxyribonuclease RuvC [Candidatus Bipolaricaulota bacterium]|nr:crossover junction endodeoxyribonuclease RuvC [Candidatus Bipolaricaulota bacterium]
MTEQPVSLGFDPGLATTGYGVVQASGHGWVVIDGGVITTPHGMPRPERLLDIYNEARELIETYHPRGIAIEEIFFATNARTAMLTAETRGVLLMATHGLPVRGYTPLQVKKRITGYGKAKKQQVQAMVKELLGLSETPRPDDMADGLALALCYLFDLQGVNKEEHDYL